LLSGGEYGIIQAIEKEELSTPEETYNFEVAEYHTYYVGDNGVLVHNTCWTTQKKGCWKDEFQIMLLIKNEVFII